VHWVDCFIDIPQDLAASTRSFWAAALGWEIGRPWPNHPEFTSLEPTSGESFVHVQVIDGPPRVHVDLAVADMNAETERLVALGATAGTRTESWQVMTSPGGMAFCLARDWREVARPEPVQWADGHTSRLFQICIDSPEEWHEQEVAFWPVATGWDLQPSDRPEFAGKCYSPMDGPIRFLLQRLGPDDDATATRAHIDLATDDVAAEVDRLTALGATLVAPGHGWVTLRTPTGMPFCVTAQSPF
jgi:hypothetical protein